MDRQDSLRNEKKFGFLVEKEKLINNLETARKISENMFVLTEQLAIMFEELSFARADTRSLKAKLNRTAIEFGLQPIPIRRKKTGTKTPGN